MGREFLNRQVTVFLKKIQLHAVNKHFHKQKQTKLHQHHRMPSKGRKKEKQFCYFMPNLLQVFKGPT